MSQTEILHASCVAWGDRAALITGRSGQGKSSLALMLMAYGCTLVADDRTELTEQNGMLLANCPDTIKGKIEARGVGVLEAQTFSNVPVICVIDMDQRETQRLPYARSTTILGVTLRRFHNCATMAFPAAIVQYLKTTPPPHS